jgi:hypothetical protein
MSRTDASAVGAAEAVERTDALLRRLPEREWTVFADIDPRYGVDHVLVGRGGVFVLASRKPAGGGVRERDGVLWLRHDSDARADKPGVTTNRQALEAARVLHREIRTRTGLGPQVTPVVVLWCEFPQRVADSTRIAFVHGRDLLGWLSERPQRLDEAGQTAIVGALRASRSAGIAGRSGRLHSGGLHFPHRGPGRRAA